jgi:hypothetical protein
LSGKRATAERPHLAHNFICCIAAFVLQSQVQRTRKRQGEPERGAAIALCLFHNGEKAGDLHNYSPSRPLTISWHRFNNVAQLQ